jgi:hypothetical protein
MLGQLPSAEIEARPRSRICARCPGTSSSSTRRTGCATFTSRATSLPTPSRTVWHRCRLRSCSPRRRYRIPCWSCSDWSASSTSASLATWTAFAANSRGSTSPRPSRPCAGASPRCASARCASRSRTASAIPTASPSCRSSRPATTSSACVAWWPTIYGARISRPCPTASGS